MGKTGGLKPQPGANPGGGPATQGKGSPDAALVNAVNDARLHPDKYPPHGNASAGPGAKMDGCTNALAHSGALDNTAATHSAFIATMPGDVVNQYPNMHKTASGGLAWDDGGPIEQAGYNGRWRDRGRRIPHRGRRRRVLDARRRGLGVGSSQYDPELRHHRRRGSRRLARWARWGN